ncbi:hypothetical protein GJ496_004025 [Pomphorhynchus laevis]|nr:hypothetical protein GJ496_004025 [Pomphorhynchus laevis]
MLSTIQIVTTTTWISYKIKGEVDCNTEGIVYFGTCRECRIHAPALAPRLSSKFRFCTTEWINRSQVKERAGNANHIKCINVTNNDEPYLSNNNHISKSTDECLTKLTEKSRSQVKSQRIETVGCEDNASIDSCSLQRNDFSKILGVDLILKSILSSKNDTLMNYDHVDDRSNISKAVRQQFLLIDKNALSN